MPQLAVVGLLLVLLAACSSSGDGEPEPAAVTGSPDQTALRQDLATLFAGDSPRPADVADGECFADRLLADTTPEQLQEGGLTDSSGQLVGELPSLPEELAGTVADAQLACIDVVESSTRALTAARKGDLDAEAYADCLRRDLPPDTQREALVATLMGEWDDPALGRLADAQLACVDEQQRP
ncbi:hypothetical protein [Nocardioides euryhalodurans]|uniref:DUF732 domain-containing protein n=1 Tax=Nocardioides euryhalodurans TaxID=2518370 RepID=A0A4P7GMN1_9ACTN|nr:hypothetical protein [Nocardioides euryhalodurans]QBR93041.1 hypothetical protein EXE57_12740 [Nocardioides euryhalodurans]